MKLLFPKFLEDQNTYEKAVLFWQEMLDTLLSDSHLSYVTYLNDTTVNGSVLNDGNPIFNAYFPSLQKAVRIIQEEAEDDDVEIGAWIDQVEMEVYLEAVPELVLSFVLAEETVPTARHLIERWILEDVDREVMAREIYKL